MGEDGGYAPGADEVGAELLGCCHRERGVLGVGGWVEGWSEGLCDEGDAVGD